MLERRVMRWVAVVCIYRTYSRRQSCLPNDIVEQETVLQGTMGFFPHLRLIKVEVLYVRVVNKQRSSEVNGFIGDGRSQI